MSAPLSHLHDFYQPPPPAWVPQTVGWYVLFIVVGLLLLRMAIRLVRSWLANRYRREALRELALLPPEQFSKLLKRTALAAWPREKVASLSGVAWLSFLNESTNDNLFDRSPADRIEEITFRSETLSSEDERSLRQTAAAWIRRHHVRS